MGVGDAARQGGRPRAAVRAALATGLAALAVLWVVHRLAFDPAIPFLWPWSPAQWILAPTPTELRVRRPVPVDAVFSRRFELEKQPSSAALRVRAFRRAEVRVNGVAVLATDGADWKKAQQVELARHLRAGSNDVVVRVENAFGPPSLWLSLALPGATLSSDTRWRVARAGGTETAAALATRAPPRGSFDDFRTALGLGGALRDAWPALLGFLLLGAALAFAICRLYDRVSAGAAEARRRATATALRLVFLLIVGAWSVLAVAGTRWLPITTGFDAEGHLEYIERVRATGGLPLADEGWEMHQPPLYYALHAAVLSVAGASVTDAAGAWLIRVVNLLLGVLGLLFVVLSVRLVFPDDARKQLFGTVLAGFLPVQLYLLPYPTNDVLAVTLGAFCFYACVRLLRDERGRFGRALVLGLGLGAAMLAKLSALMLVPPMLVAVAWRRMTAREDASRGAGFSVAVVCAAMLIVCGWHYARVALRFGDPFVANWDAAAGRVWWQDPGYRTPADLVRVTRALLEPNFAASDGLLAGLYTSLWADSFAGGVAELQLAPPWSRDLLELGPLLGVPLSLAIAIGWLATSARALRKRDPLDALAPALVATAGLAALWIGIVVPILSIAKASYVMIVLAPLAVLGATGLDLIAGRARWRRCLVLTLLLMWAATSYATYLVRESAPATLAFAGRQLLATPNRAVGLGLLRAALARDPSSWAARAALAEALYGAPEQHDALEAELARSGAIADAPPGVHALLGLAKLRAGRDEAARAHLLSAAQDTTLLEPRFRLAQLLARRGEDDEAVRWARDVLRISPTERVAHELLADLYERGARHDEASYHRAFAVRVGGRAATQAPPPSS